MSRTFTATLASMLFVCAVSCGGGSTVDPGPGGGNAIITGAEVWTSIGGGPANNYLSANVGPAAIGTSGQIVIDHGATSAAQIAPDGSVLVGAGLALVSFSRDGEVNWRYPTGRAVREFFLDAEGNIYLEAVSDVIHVLSPDGDLLYETELKFQSDFQAVGADGVLYITSRVGVQDPILEAWDESGLLWEYQLDIRLLGLLPLADGGIAIADASADIKVLNADGSDRWSVLDDDLRFEEFWENPWGGSIYVSASDPLTGTNDQLIGFDLDGTPTGGYLAQLGAGNWLCAGLDMSGRSFWYDTFGGLLAMVWVEGEVVWDYEAGNSLLSEPLVCSDGWLIAHVQDATETGRYNLLGFNPEGEIVQSLLVNDGPQLPACDSFGRIYLGNNEGMFAYERDATFAWGYDFGGTINSAVCAADGTIYYVGGNVLYASDETGAELWRWSATGNLTQPVVGPDGIVYTSTDGTLFAVDTEGGGLVWQALIDGAEVLRLAVGSEGHIYAGTSLGTLAAFLPGGLVSWEYDAGSAVTTRAAIGGDGSLYFGCEDGMLRAVNAAGAELWRYDIAGNISNTPSVSGSDVLAVSQEGGLFRIDGQGNLLWHYEVPDYIYTAAAVGPDGTVYVGTDDFLQETVPVPPSGTTAAPVVGSSSRQASNADPVLLDLNGEGLGLYAINPDGSEKWNLHTSRGVFDTVAVDNAGYIYLGVYGQLFSLNPDGTERWRHRNPLFFNGIPSISPAGSILFPTGNRLTILAD